MADVEGKIETDVVVETQGLTRILPGPVPVRLVHNIDLSIKRHEMVAVTGPSGSGKSSLLYLLGLLDQPTEGRVLIEGRDTNGLGQEELSRIRLEKIGFVFQFHFLLPEFKITDNVAVPMRKLGRLEPKELKARAANLLEAVGLGDQIKKRPDQMSGGQRQRVAIARALANDPQIILADEPTGSLDQQSSNTVFEIFEKLAHEDGRSVIMVTHEMDLAARCDRQIRLVDGALVDDGLNG